MNRKTWNSHFLHKCVWIGSFRAHLHHQLSYPMEQYHTQHIFTVYAPCLAAQKWPWIPDVLCDVRLFSAGFTMEDERLTIVLCGTASVKLVRQLFVSTDAAGETVCRPCAAGSWRTMFPASLNSSNLASDAAHWEWSCNIKSKPHYCLKEAEFSLRLDNEGR